MKRIFFLLSAMFIIAGCADEEGNSNRTTEMCPISSSDYKYKQVAGFNKYYSVLMSAEKAIYKDNVM